VLLVDLGHSHDVLTLRKLHQKYRDRPKSLADANFLKWANRSRQTSINCDAAPAPQL
jgi:hypothetical protein